MAASNHRRQKVHAVKVSTRKRTKRTRSMDFKSSSSLSTPVGIFILISFVLLVNALIDLVEQQRDHNDNQQRHPSPRLFRPMGAHAGGSKSKSKSSKTTVIAISGGGGHSAKPHPVPVPWPVIHCHHHHHHLKYVPKPILVHHWVKKQKAAASLPIEFHESSNEHYQVMDSRGVVVPAAGGQSAAALPIQQHTPTMALASNDLGLNSQHQMSYLPDNNLAPLDQQQQQLGSAYSNMGFAISPNNPNNNNHLMPKVPFPDLMDGSQLVSALSNEFDTGGAQISTSASSNLFDGAHEMALPPVDLKNFSAQPKFSSKTGGIPHFSDKQLEKLTKSILSAQQKGAAHSLQGNKKHHASGHNKPPRDTDSGLDSLKSTNVVALATSSATTGHHHHQQAPDINGTFYGLDGYDFGPSSHADGQSSAPSATNETRHGGTKPSHPFDDLHDQLKDESMAHQNIVTAENQRNSPKTATTTMMAKQQQQQDLSLAQANLKEESDSRQAYQRLAFESARQLVALNEADRQRALAGLMMAGPQQQQQQQHMMMSRPPLGQQSQQVVAMPLPSQVGANQLFNPQAAAASQRTMSESHAISLMTHLAERMAQLEASNLVERHRMLAGAGATANKSAHSTSGPRKTTGGSSSTNHLLGGFWGNLGLFARATPVRLRTANHKDSKRRLSSGAQVHVQPTTTTVTTTKSAPTNYQRFLTWQSTSSTTTQSPRVAQQSSGFLTTNDNDYVITASPLYMNLMTPSGGNYRNQQASGISHNQAASSQLLMSAYGQRNSAMASNSQPQEKLLTEGSSQVNKIAQPSFVRPPPGFSTTANVAAPVGAQQPKRNFGSAPAPSPASKPPPPNGNSQQQLKNQVTLTKSAAGTVSTTPPSAAPPTTTTLMSPDQESNFYLGQREHLASELVEASSTSSSLVPPSPAVPGTTDQTAPIAQQSPHGSSPLPVANSMPTSPSGYSSQPSNVVGQSVVAAPSGMQQQQQQFAPSPEQLQPFLQFPMSPAQWSSEALRSLNAGEQQQQQQQAASDQVTSAAASEEDAQSNEQSQLDGTQESSQADQGQDASGGDSQQDKLLSLDPNDGQSHTYYLDSNGNLESATSDQVQQQQQQQQQQQAQPQQDMSQFEQMLMLHNPQQQQQAMMMAAAGGGGYQMATPSWPFGSHTQQFQTPFTTATVNWAQQAASEPAAQSLNMQQSVQPYGYYTTGTPVDANWPPLSVSSVSPYDARMHQHFLAQSFPAMAQTAPSMQFASPSVRKQKMVAPPGGGNMDQYVASSLASPMNEMNQLRQLQGRLAGGMVAGQAGGNYSSLAGSLGGRLLPSQMQSRFPLAGQAGAGGLPQMPQIPNIPQPPQMPNLPMPPPGMMQMAASVALPLAMARVTRQNNRFRNNQVNSAATQGGSTTTPGQRFLRGASNLTNRFMRTRRRPASTSSPQLAMGGGGSSGVGQSSTPFNRQRRRRPSLLSLSAPNRVSSMFGQPSSATPLTSTAHRPHRHQHHGQPMSMRFIQTVVDMSRRPPVVAAASNLAASATSGVLSAATKATAAAATAGASAAAAAAAAAAASPPGSQSGAARVAAATKVISGVANAAASAAAATATSGPVDKLKPKIDHIDELQEIGGRQPVVLRNSGRPTTRSGAHTSRGAGSSPSSSVVFAGLPPIALTDGTLHRFESMTSPVDLLNRQLRRARELEWHRQQTQHENIAASTMAHAHQQQQQAQLRQLHHQPQLELMRLRPYSPQSTAMNIPSQTQSSYYQLVTAATPAPQQTDQFVNPATTSTTTTTGYTSSDEPTSGQASEHHDDYDAHQQPDLMPAGLTGPVNTSTFHLPQHAPQVVTNHFNLLMFTNKNVTGNLLAPGNLTPHAPNESEGEQAPQLVEPTAAAVEAVDIQQQTQRGEPEKQVAAAANQPESNQQVEDEQRRQYEAMLADNQEQLQQQQQAHDANRIEQQPVSSVNEQREAQSVRDFAASNAKIDPTTSAAPNSRQQESAPNGMILIKMTPSEASGSESKENRRTSEPANGESTSSRLLDSGAPQPATPAVLVEEKSTKAPKRKSKKKTKSTPDADEKKHRVATTKSPAGPTTTTTSSTTAAPLTLKNLSSQDYAAAGSQWTELKVPPATSPKVDEPTSIKGQRMNHLKTVLTKRSTSVRPTSPSALDTIKVVDSEFRQGSENLETISAPEITTGEHRSTGTTSERRTTLAPVAQAQTTADDQAADYVRAIKLVRGVAYPWPPPTQSSKMLATSETPEQRLKRSLW